MEKGGMTPEKMFHELLGLGMKWEVVECEFDRDKGTVRLRIQETAELWKHVFCSQDTSECSCYDHNSERVWEHLHVFEHTCEIVCRLPRAKCRKCGRVFQVEPPWQGLSAHFSKAFEAYALLLAREMPVSRAAKILGITDMRLWRILFTHVDRAYQEADFSQVTCVGVDELNIRKGHEYVSVFADLLARRVLFATEGKDRQTWERFIQCLSEHNGHAHAVKWASMDMSKAYVSGVGQWCRNAQVVFDKFHIIANVNKAIDKVRRAEIAQANKGVWEQLHRSQWLWRKNPENLTEKEQERLGAIDQESLCTAKAYQLKLELQKIYQLGRADVARRRLRIWCWWAKRVAREHSPRLLKPMVKIAEMIESKFEGVLAHWTSGLTNAFMEGLNSVFQATKRKARGYRSSTHLITILYFVAGKLRIPAR